MAENVATITSLKGLTFTVRVSRLVSLRLRLAVWIVRFAGFVGGYSVKVTKGDSE